MRVFKKKVLLSNQTWMKKRRRRERPKPWSQVDNIPPDVTLEILSRLPPKSIMRHRCVSKLWSYLTSLPSFINSFTSRSTSRPPTLMVTLSSESAKYVLFFPTTPKPSSYSPLYSYEITNLDWKDSIREHPWIDFNTRIQDLEPNLETVFSLTTSSCSAQLKSRLVVLFRIRSIGV
ncbi:unnamed protein product [Brassica napus]|uniref:(rape) hypothetical protein n=1 Tax=Brassica napus TaxID=3708 RepID=A0A816UW89_BRANA|nr:unnamed protein product [Brassica napus]